MTPESLASALIWTGTLGATGLTAHTVLNLSRLREPPTHPDWTGERISVLVPARDEADRIPGCLNSLRDQLQVGSVEVLVLDDGSTDGTAQAVAQAQEADGRIRLISGAPLPPGWLGKPFACHQLAQQASGSLLVFLDADVRLAPHALAASAQLLRGAQLDLISPYPRQLARTWGERLVQPLLQWSWLTTLPLRQAESSPRASMATANGQFLVIDARVYAASGGHAGVRDQVLEDIALARAVRAAGGRGGMVNGASLATCRMYQGWAQISAGYGKSLWSAFGSRTGALAVMTVLGLIYLLPPLAALNGSGVGAVGYAVAVLGRYLVAERTQGRSLPDALTHPASIVALAWLTARSWQAKARGSIRWKGREV